MTRPNALILVTGLIVVFHYVSDDIFPAAFGQSANAAPRDEEPAIAESDPPNSSDDPIKSLRDQAQEQYRLGNITEAERLFNESLKLRFADMSDEELCRKCLHAIDADHRLGDENGDNDAGLDEDTNYALLYEECLSEMIRRGTPEIEEFLIGTLEYWNDRYWDAIDRLDEDYNEWISDIDSEPSWVDSHHHSRDYEIIEQCMDNVELVTALRRIQKKRDPLQVFVISPIPASSTFPELPEFEIFIRNVDVEHQKMDLGSREHEGSWAIEVRNARGGFPPRRLFVRTNMDTTLSLVLGGGQILWRSGDEIDADYRSGISRDFDLRLNGRYGNLAPGKYLIEFLYHNRLYLYEGESPATRIVTRSQSISLVVQAKQIVVTHSERQRIKALLGAWSDEEPRRIIVGKYGEWAHEFIPPNSELGQLLPLGWKSVPDVIAMLGEKDVTAEKRAQLLALLYLVTGEYDPRPVTFLKPPKDDSSNPNETEVKAEGSGNQRDGFQAKQMGDKSGTNQPEFQALIDLIQQETEGPWFEIDGINPNTRHHREIDGAVGDPSAIGAYERLTKPELQRDGGLPPGGFGGGGFGGGFFNIPPENENKPVKIGGEIDPEQQTQLIKLWQEFAKGLEVVAE